MNEYSGLRKVIIQTNPTSTQGRLFMFQLRKCHFLVQVGKKKKTRSCLALVTTALVEVKTGYMQTCFSSKKRRQNLRRLGKEHWCYCPSMSLSSCQTLLHCCVCNGVAGLWASNEWQPRDSTLRDSVTSMRPLAPMQSLVSEQRQLSTFHSMWFKLAINLMLSGYFWGVFCSVWFFVLF